MKILICSIVLLIGTIIEIKMETDNIGTRKDSWFIGLTLGWIFALILFI